MTTRERQEKPVSNDKNAATIGTYVHNGKTYEIDWPNDIEDETQKDWLAGAIYLNDRHVGECGPNFTQDGFTSASEVMASAVAVIEAGETDDQRGESDV